MRDTAPTHTAPTRDLDLFVAVAIGGVIGASARYFLGEIVPTPRDQWPLATFIINLTGAFILGLVIEFATAYAPDPGVGGFARRLRPFLVTGVLGGYTTFSTYMVEAHGLVLEARPLMAGAYVFGSLLLGVLLVVLGMTVGKALFRGARIPHGRPDTAEEEAEIELTEDEA